MVEPICFWTACIAHSGHCWSSSLILANLHQVYYMFKRKVVYAFKCVLKIYFILKKHQINFFLVFFYAFDIIILKLKKNIIIYLKNTFAPQ
jgi:hypothetical protein